MAILAYLIRIGLPFWAGVFGVGVLIISGSYVPMSDAHETNAGYLQFTDWHGIHLIVIGALGTAAFWLFQPVGADEPPRAIALLIGLTSIVGA